MPALPLSGLWKLVPSASWQAAHFVGSTIAFPYELASAMRASAAVWVTSMVWVTPATTAAGFEVVEMASVGSMPTAGRTPTSIRLTWPAEIMLAHVDRSIVATKDAAFEPGTTTRRGPFFALPLDHSRLRLVSAALRGRSR